MTEGKSDFLDIVYAVIGLCISALNIAEINYILKIKYKKTFDKLLLSLAISDTFVGFSVTVFKFFDVTLGGSLLKWSEERTFLHLFMFSLAFSLSNLLAITIDRYLAVKFPIKHRAFASARRSNIAILIVWLASFVALLINALIIIYGDKRNEYFLAALSITILITGILLISIYTSILYSIYKTRIKTFAEGQTNRSHWQGMVSTFRTSGTAERSVFISSCFVSISFIISSYPFAIEYLIVQSGKDVSFLSKLCILLNSLLNPFTYFFKSYLWSRRSRIMGNAIEMN